MQGHAGASSRGSVLASSQLARRLAEPFRGESGKKQRRRPLSPPKRTNLDEGAAVVCTMSWQGAVLQSDAGAPWLVVAVLAARMFLLSCEFSGRSEESGSTFRRR